ncbi:polysaccharide biosynthesis domain protein, partial [Bacteroides fragilis str. DS-71]
MLAIPMGIGLMLLSHSIVLVFAGSQYSEAVWPLCIFGFRFITLMVENITAQQTMFLHGKEKIIALCNAMWGV